MLCQCGSQGRENFATIIMLTTRHKFSPKICSHAKFSLEKNCSDAASQFLRPAHHIATSHSCRSKNFSISSDGGTFVRRRSDCYKISIPIGDLERPDKLLNSSKYWQVGRPSKFCHSELACLMPIRDKRRRPQK